MIGVEITNKESGIPLFMHEFRPGVLNSMTSDIRGGLITAIMNVMSETFDSPQQTKIVNYGQFHAILYEGEYVYGVLFTYQTGPIFEKFISKLVEQFEKKYGEKLKSIMDDNPIVTPVFDFSKECNEAYNNIFNVDIQKLSKLMSLVGSGEKIFSNMLIFSRPGMNQIFSALDNQKFYGFTEDVTNAIQTLLELAFRTPFPVEEFTIRLSKNFYCIMFGVYPFVIVIFVDKDNVVYTQERIKIIQERFYEEEQKKQ